MMNQKFKQELIKRNILVGTLQDEKNRFEVLYSLANIWGIKIVQNPHLVDSAILQDVRNAIPTYVPRAFYEKFPYSVKELTSEQLLFDQLMHYFNTYFMGDFTGGTIRSYFEDEFDRIAFKEHVDIKEFKVVDVQCAMDKIEEICNDLLSGSRPLSQSNYELVKLAYEDLGYTPMVDIASKNTACKLLIDTKNAAFAKGLRLSDVIKVVQELNYSKYGNKNVKKLNFKNSDRKFITALIHYMFNESRCNVYDCWEKKKIWCGLLHHIHFKPKTMLEKEFVNFMRGEKNRSRSSAFEQAMNNGNLPKAVDALGGEGAIMRNLNYLVSRFSKPEEVSYILDHVSGDNALLLIQLMNQYYFYKDEGPRTFSFSRFNQLVTHKETEKETARRGTRLDSATANVMYYAVRNKLMKSLHGKIKNVYIDNDMYNIALPLNESTTNDGFGVLPKGSRIEIPRGKKIRAFTYWEKVNDIDLSLIGIDKRGRRHEFSWRNMCANQSGAIAFSGDVTDGYNGGSEFFDVDLDEVRRLYPDMEYMVFCDNVYSSGTFTNCYCTAGFMTRDKEDSGEIYEPKTVKSSFKVTCDSKFAYLFAIDLGTNSFVWLNTARESNNRVAGISQFAWLDKYIYATEVISLGDFFEMMAENVVEESVEADLIISDTVEIEGVETIHSYDIEKVMKYF